MVLNKNKEFKQGLKTSVNVREKSVITLSGFAIKATHFVSHYSIQFRVNTKILICAAWKPTDFTTEKSSILHKPLHASRCSNHDLLSGLIIRIVCQSCSVQLRSCCLTTGSLRHIIHTHLADNSQSNDSLCTRSKSFCWHICTQPN